MPPSKKTKPINENAALRTALIDADREIHEQSPHKIESPTSAVADHHSGEEISLTESESRYRRLFETAKDGILILAGDTGRIIDANPFLQEMLGYSKAELVGKMLWEIGLPKDIPASQEAMRRLQEKEHIRYEDIPLESKTGQHKQVEFVSNVYLVDGLKVIQCNIRDIAARKHIEERARIDHDKLLVLVRELQGRDRDMQVLNQMNYLLQSCITQAEAYQVINLNAAELFPGQSGCLAISHGRGQKLEVVVRWGNDLLIEPAFPLEDCWALRRGKLHEVINPQFDLLCNHFTHTPDAGYLCLPLTVQGETLGLLCVMDITANKIEHQLSQQQLAITVGETIKLCLSNLKLRDELRQQASHDTLTSLFNRRYLDETLPRELLAALRRNVPLCIVMLDIDNFKQFNDTLGHAMGDTLLREFGHSISENLRKSDISCRYGGDEFVIVLPDSTMSDTEERVEQIRLFIKNLNIYDGTQSIGKISLSAGIAAMPEHGTTATELLRAADQALYTAKQAGRDRIAIYEPA